MKLRNGLDVGLRLRLIRPTELPSRRGGSCRHAGLDGASACPGRSATAAGPRQGRASARARGCRTGAAAPGGRGTYSSSRSPSGHSTSTRCAVGETGGDEVPGLPLPVNGDDGAVARPDQCASALCATSRKVTKFRGSPLPVNGDDGAVARPGRCAGALCATSRSSVSRSRLALVRDIAAVRPVRRSFGASFSRVESGGRPTRARA